MAMITDFNCNYLSSNPSVNAPATTLKSRLFWDWDIHKFAFGYYHRVLRNVFIFCTSTIFVNSEELHVTVIRIFRHLCSELLLLLQLIVHVMLERSKKCKG